MNRPSLTLVMFALNLCLVLVYLAGLGDAFLERKIINCHEEPFKCQNYFDGINYFLLSTVDTDNVAQNMAAIESWIAREAARPLTKKMASRMSALLLIRDLESLVDEPGLCRPSTGALMYANDVALRGVLAKLEPGKVPERRIEKIVNHYAKYYLRYCDLEIRLENLDNRSLQYIYNFIGELIGSHAKTERTFNFQTIDPVSFVDEQPKKASDFAKIMKPLGTEQDIKIIHNWLKIHYFEDPRSGSIKKAGTSLGKLVVDLHDFHNLFHKYMVKPCEDYVFVLEGLFQSHWTLQLSRKLHAKSGNQDSLDKHTAYYYGCVKFLQRESQISDGLQKMIKSESARSEARVTQSSSSSK